MFVNYEFVPEFESTETKYRSDVISYAGKLLEIVDAHTLIVGVDNDDKPFVYKIRGRMVDGLEIELD